MLTDKQRAQTAARQKRFRERQQEARLREQQKKGLPRMPAITTMPGQARWRAALQSAHVLVAQVDDEMATYYAQRSESWQEGEAGVEFAERQEAVAVVLSGLEELTR
jgi:hypothetical protein